LLGNTAEERERERERENKNERIKKSKLDRAHLVKVSVYHGDRVAVSSQHLQLST